MSPEEREELLAAHALGALPGPEAAEVEALVRRDPGAAERLAAYREIADLDPAVAERMLRSARRMRQSGRRRFLVRRAAVITASLVVVAVLGVLIGVRLGGGDDSAPVPAPIPEVKKWPPPPPAGHAADYSVDAQEVMIELRVWQNVDDPRDVWVRAHAPSAGGEAPDPVPFPLDEEHPESVKRGGHDYRDLTVAGVELRLVQRISAPERIFVRACPTPCFSALDPRGEVPVWEWWPWQISSRHPLGMIALPLDHGHSEFNGARYRYGDSAIAVPVGNPELEADREYLLALRDALAGTAELNWSASTPTSEWEGVRLTGWPPRVTGLDLADRGLDGEIWGWLGDLTDLTELRLDGNRLTGRVPSKLARLTGLRVVGLAGNALEGCVPPALRGARYHDLARLGLADCDPPTRILISEGPPGDYPLLSEGSYRWQYRDNSPIHAVLDLPPGQEFHVYLHGTLTDIVPPPLDRVRVAFGQENWLGLHRPNGLESGRSHYAEDDPAIFAILEQIAASVWVTVGDDRGEWVWP